MFITLALGNSMPPDICNCYLNLKITKMLITQQPLELEKKCWVSPIRPLCWVSLFWMSLCWVSSCWMSWRNHDKWKEKINDFLSQQQNVFHGCKFNGNITLSFDTSHFYVGRGAGPGGGRGGGRGDSVEECVKITYKKGPGFSAQSGKKTKCPLVLLTLFLQWKHLTKKLE